MSQADTSQEARQVLLDIYRRMSPAVKVRRIFEAYQTGKMLATAGLRELHPDATEKRIWYLWANCHLGEKLFNEVYGTIPDD
jgi:hypothetical protein